MLLRQPSSWSPCSCPGPFGLLCAQGSCENITLSTEDGNALGFPRSPQFSQRKSHMIPVDHKALLGPVSIPIQSRLLLLSRPNTLASSLLLECSRYDPVSGLCTCSSPSLECPPLMATCLPSPPPSGLYSKVTFSGSLP